jgi:hypothetical protein
MRNPITHRYNHPHRRRSEMNSAEVTFAIIIVLLIGVALGIGISIGLKDEGTDDANRD